MVRPTAQIGPPDRTESRILVLKCWLTLHFLLAATLLACTGGSEDTPVNERAAELEAQAFFLQSLPSSYLKQNGAHNG